MRAICAVAVAALWMVGGAFSQDVDSTETNLAYAATHPNLSGNDPRWLKDTEHNCWLFDGFPSRGETVSWSGECKDGLASGEGTETWYLGGVFAERRNGIFSGGSLNGHGKAEVADGSTYEGDWLYGARHGRGVLTLRDRSRYDGLLPGAGIYTRRDGHSCDASVVRRNGELRVIPTC